MDIFGAFLGARNSLFWSYSFIGVLLGVLTLCRTSQCHLRQRSSVSALGVRSQRVPELGKAALELSSAQNDAILQEVW